MPDAERSSTAKLTEQIYWDTVYGSESDGLISKDRRIRPLVRHGVKTAIKRRLSPRVVQSLGNYDDYLLWEVILPRFLSGRAGQRVVEIGSAPGELLVGLHRRFGLVPYGIEYSGVGADVNRRLFATQGLNPRNVLQVDFFAPAVHAAHKEGFDIVLSRGFIEHFTDPTEVIDRHLNLLKKGGLLFVSVPNLRGVNYLLSWMCDRRVLAMHNVSIMTRTRLAQLFDRRRVDSLFCDYYGTFNVRLINARTGSWRWRVLSRAWKAQAALNILFRYTLGRGGLESRWSSPHLLFVGIKR